MPGPSGSSRTATAPGQGIRRSTWLLVFVVFWLPHSTKSENSTSQKLKAIQHKICCTAVLMPCPVLSAKPCWFHAMSRIPWKHGKQVCMTLLAEAGAETMTGFCIMRRCAECQHSLQLRAHRPQ